MLNLKNALFVLALVLAGCSTLGGGSSSSLEQLADGYGYVRALRLTALDGLNRGAMNVERAKRYQSIANQARMGLDVAGVFSKPETKAPRDLADVLAATAILAQVRGEMAAMKPIDRADVDTLRMKDDEARAKLEDMIAAKS